MRAVNCSHEGNLPRTLTGPAGKAPETCVSSATATCHEVQRRVIVGSESPGRKRHTSPEFSVTRQNSSPDSEVKQPGTSNSPRFETRRHKAQYHPTARFCDPRNHALVSAAKRHPRTSHRAFPSVESPRSQCFPTSGSPEGLGSHAEIWFRRQPTGSTGPRHRASEHQTAATSARSSAG